MRMFRGALGTNNVDHCTRLCHSTSVAAMQRAINTAAASGSMREIEAACDVIFIAGANTTESHPVFGAALKRAHEKRATLIVADPRRTELAGRADIHLQMQPGTDVALYSAMLHHILALGLENRDFIATRTHDFEKVRAAVKPYPPDKAAKITGIPAEQIRRAAEIRCVPHRAAGIHRQRSRRPEPMVHRSFCGLAAAETGTRGGDSLRPFFRTPLPPRNEIAALAPRQIGAPVHHGSAHAEEGKSRQAVAIATFI